MKAIHLCSSAVVSILLASLPVAAVRAADPLKSGSAESPAEVSTETDADDLFRVGETYKVSTLWLYWKAYANQIPKRFDDFDALLKKAGAPAPVVADLQHDRQMLTPLPWAKTWDTWNDAEKKIWIDGITDFNPWRIWLTGKTYDKAFYFYLGRESINAWYNIEKAVSDNDSTIADRTQTLKDCLLSFHTLSTDPGYTHARGLLASEVLAVLKEFDAMYDAINDPLSGGAVTQETVTKLGTEAKKLRDLARAGKLLTK